MKKFTDNLTKEQAIDFLQKLKDADAGAIDIDSKYLKNK